MKLTPKEKLQVAAIGKAETVVDWDMQFKLQPRTTFNGEQYEAWTKSQLPQLAELKVISDTSEEQIRKHGIRVGEDTYLYRRKLPTHIKCHPGFLSIRRTPWIERMSLKVWAPGKPIGQVQFDRPVSVPILTQAGAMSDPWMSLTPNEILTQRPGIRRAKGRVLVGGLGLGWFTREILKREQVKHVTVVDINADLLKVIGQPIIDAHPGRVTMVHSDVWDHVKDNTEYDSYLLDIWKGYPNAAYDRKFQAFKDEHPGCVWGWGDVKTYPTGT
jgi:hypothetical protein